MYPEINNISDILSVMPRDSYMEDKKWFNMFLNHDKSDISKRCELFNESYGMSFDSKTGNIVARPPEALFYMNNDLVPEDVFFPIIYEEFDCIRISSTKGINKISMQLEVDIAVNRNIMDFIIHMKNDKYLPFFVLGNKGFELAGARDINTGWYMIGFELDDIKKEFSLLG